MITKESTLKQILEIKDADQILIDYHVPCLFCPMIKQEMDQLTIGQVCEMYEIDLGNLLKDLNK